MDKLFKMLNGLTFVVIIVAILAVTMNRCTKEDPDNLVTRMIDYSKIPMVKATINGREALFLLDTGATISIIDINQIAQYNIRNTGISEMSVAGYGGVDVISYDLDKPQIKMGTVYLSEEFHGKDIKTIVEVIRKGTGKKVLGIIGNNNISTSRLILNFKDGTITR